MRLTLRNLLAYLNDELSPDQTRELGPKIAASEVALQLIEKLQTLTRRRRLSAPDLHLDEDGSPQDPNYVAAYLDCELTEEEQGVFEALCLGNDIHLAEIAACVQLGTLGGQEAIKIPPTARQRMYGLVSGREAIHNRPVPAQATPKPIAPLEVDGAAEDEDEALLLLDPLYQKMQGRWAGRFVPIAAGILLLGLFGLMFWLTRSQPEPAMLAGLTVPSLASSAVADASKPKDAPAAGDAQKVVMAALRPEALVGRLSALVAARPALPPNLLLALGQDAVVEPAPLDVPPPQPAVPAPVEVDRPKEPTPVDRPPPPVVKVAVGQYESDPAKEGLLFRLNTPGDWRAVRSQAPILTGESLLCLPGSRAEISLANRLRLTLISALPADPNAKERDKESGQQVEAGLILVQNPDADLDVTLERGRIAIARKGDGQAKVKLRYHGTEWHITIENPDTEFGVEVAARVPSGSMDGVPNSKLTLAVQRGLINVERGGERVALRDRQGFIWDSRHTEASGKSLGETRDIALPWLSKRPTYPNDVKDSVASFQKRLGEKLNQNAATTPWLKVACDEALLSKKPWEQYLAISSLAACDQLASVVAALDDPDRSLLRRAALETLQHYRGRQPGQEELLKQALRQRGYRDADAAIVIDLLRGTDQANRATIEKLLEQLLHFRLAIRELAWLNLQQLVQIDRPTYDPAAHIELRERSVEALKKKLLQ